MSTEEIKKYLKDRIELMKHHKPKSYTNKIRKHECQYLLNMLEKDQKKEDGYEKIKKWKHY